MQKQTFIQETWGKIIFLAIELSFPLVRSFSTRDSEYVAITEYRLYLLHFWNMSTTVVWVWGQYWERILFWFRKF